MNPYFPPEELTKELKSNFEKLLCGYPSGIRVNNLLAAKYFNLNKEFVVVGNGAAELIKSLMESLKGKIGTIIPTFDEYINRIKDNEIVYYLPKNDFKYDHYDLINYFDNKNIDVLVLVNPDNPSGNFISKNKVIELVKWCKNNSIVLILDESFVDFANEQDNSLLSNEILEEFNNLVILKSISKSFGVPGLRLGILASSSEKFIGYIKNDIAIWNINSFAENYLQIAEKYKKEYSSALATFKDVRIDFTERLKSITCLRVIPTQSNYVMCEIINTEITAKSLVQKLLSKNILVKDLSSKTGISGEFIRIAIKSKEENVVFINALESILNKSHKEIA